MAEDSNKTTVKPVSAKEGAAKPVPSTPKVEKVKVPEGTMMVKNISSQDLFLRNGTIRKGEQGLATKAEASSYGKTYIERI